MLLWVAGWGGERRPGLGEAATLSPLKPRLLRPRLYYDGKKWTGAQLSAIT